MSSTYTTIIFSFLEADERKPSGPFGNEKDQTSEQLMQTVSIHIKTSSIYKLP